MAVRATVSRFPTDPDAQEASGLPWGVTVTPFSPVDELGNPPVSGSNGNLVPRCDNCWAYFNSYCELEQWAWTCSLCGTLNGLTSETIARYSRPELCAEMCSSFIDLELPDDGEEAVKARPVYVAAVDLASSEEFLELIKSALLAALEALGPGSLFGLVTFSHKIGLYDVQGPIPVVKNVFIPPDTDASLPFELEDAMPLFSFLAPVDTCKDRIAAALETLKPTTSWERTTAAGQGLDGILLGGRGFGAAMEALINYLGSEYGNTFALARVFTFLSGPPDYGAGQLDTRRYGEQYASKGEDADCALLPEQTPFYKELAAVAVQSGVCVDIFAVTNEYTDLASLKFLSIESGGSLFLYSNTDDSTLPQDIYSLKRHLRIRTFQYATAANMNELYDSVDPEVVLSILVHKVISASLEQGIREGRILLQDWLVILTAQYNEAYKLVQHGNESLLSRVDVAFSQCPQLQPLSRLVFALLRSPLLRLHEEGVHPDYRIYLQCLFSALEPGSLHRAIYPVLTSYTTPDKQAYPRHSLSRAALITSGSPIFFLDAFTNLIVYYSSTADPALPFPPPQDCLLRTTINKLKQDRSITPKLTFIRGGQDDATVFENYLIEEQDVDGNGLTSVVGFVSFLDEVTQRVAEYLA
ncbi:protein transport protein SEC23 D-like isoform X4 [Aristolochia californica]|uniref:protein transport protein SEC23 D-like isoform X4 n=1 Tax=Aristolochia californica TaxID=171875 RepID=UPI0035DA8F93